MTTPPLSTRSLLELIELFEHSGDPIRDAEGQRLHGVPGWALFDRTSLSASEIAEWMTCVGYAGGFPAPCGDDHVAVDLEEDDDPSRFVYRCPETFRRKFVSANAVGVYAVAPKKMLHQIAALLDIPQALRRGIDTPALEGTLWGLGKMRIGPALVNVWFVRGLPQSIEQVFQHFESAALPNQGLILTAGCALPPLIHPPRAYRIVPMKDIIIGAPSPCVDIDLLHRLLVSSPGERPAQSMPVRFDPYTNVLVVNTKSNQPWSIKGERQIAVVRYLYEQATQDRWWVPAAEILAAVYGPKKTGRSQRISDIFRGNAFWAEYLTHDDQGRYGFRLD